jgi:nicotinamide phosphoribosyltransferase
MNNLNPFLVTDGYKTGHHMMYPKGTTLVYSNFTPRHGKHSNVDLGGVISFGQQMVMRQIKEMFDENFFKKELVGQFAMNDLMGGDTLERAKTLVKNGVCQEIKDEYSMYLSTDYDVSHIEALWDLGYLPIKVKSLPEGTFVPYGVPVLTIVNTKPEFFWLTNFLETLISNMLWMPMTAATTAFAYKKILAEACENTNKNAKEFVEFQGHNFGMRGMAGIDATIYSGLGHATSFMGDDSLPTISAARRYYDAKGFVVGSVNATEHSVMCAGTKGDEIGTFRYLMNQFPTGILSIVSDTWDLWKVLTEYLPQLKEEILARDGKIVIRPDSGDPVDIICGNPDAYIGSKEQDSGMRFEDFAKNAPQSKGVIELLWDLFGGTVNDQGFKVLDPHIGAIYGDSITLGRAQEIVNRLKVKGFASTNIVLGIGSYTYQFVTRDTHGFAMKATYVEVMQNIDGGDNEGSFIPVGREIFKDPITGDGSKKSARGMMQIVDDNPGRETQYRMLDGVSHSVESNGELNIIFEDGTFTNQVTLEDVRNHINQLVYGN